MALKSKNSQAHYMGVTLEHVKILNISSKVQLPGI